MSETTKSNPSFDEEVTMTCKQVAKYDSKFLLIWGWTAVIIGVIVYWANVLTYYNESQAFSFYPNPTAKWGFLWIALPVIAGIIQWGCNKGDNQNPTPLYRMLTSVSRVTIGMVFLCAVLTAVFHYNHFFVILLILAIWCCISGFMLDSVRIQRLGYGGLAMAIAMFGVAPTLHIPLLVVGIMLTLVIPGYVLKKENQHE